MDQAVRQFIHRYTMHTMNPDAVEELIGMLPSDDLTLDRWFVQTVESGEAWEFTFLAVAAQASKRLVDARHLVKGAPLLAQQSALAETVRRMQQDAAADYLLQAVRKGILDQGNAAWALFFIAAWYRDRRKGLFPEDLGLLAYSLTTGATLGDEAAFYLIGAGVVTKDDKLLNRLRGFYEQYPDGDSVWPQKRKRAEDVAEKLLDSRISGTELLPEPPPKLRRVVAPQELERKINNLAKPAFRQLMYTLESIALGEKIRPKVHSCQHVEPILECRIDSEYRLLFRVRPTEVEVLDIVSHRDVPRAVQALDSLL